MRIIRTGSSCLAGAATAAGRGRNGVSRYRIPAAGPVTANTRTRIFTVHFSPFQALRLHPKPDPKTGSGTADELTIHDLLSPPPSKRGRFSGRPAQPGRHAQPSARRSDRMPVRCRTDGHVE